MYSIGMPSLHRRINLAYEQIFQDGIILNTSNGVTDAAYPSGQVIEHIDLIPGWSLAFEAIEKGGNKIDKG